VPSKYAHGRLLDLIAEHRMQTVPSGHIDIDAQPLLEELLDPDKMEGVEPAAGVIIDEQIEIAVRASIIAGGRAEQIEPEVAPWARMASA
jgi:hypothetical protein